MGGGTKANPCCWEAFEMQSCSCRGRPSASACICPVEGCHVLTSLAKPRLGAGSVIHICSEPSAGLRTGSPHRQAKMIYSDWWDRISSFLVKPSSAPSVCQHQGAPLSSCSRRLKREVTQSLPHPSLFKALGIQAGFFAQRPRSPSHAI